ncbi:hypothetical protein BJF78_34335 [Pseudonocardia sp. CNS-139]|nr:hypothetical protein BJF78_34335 [Pseudonocardia sp. CNS-139]
MNQRQVRRAGTYASVSEKSLLPVPCRPATYQVSCTVASALGTTTSSTDSGSPSMRQPPTTQSA